MTDEAVMAMADRIEAQAAEIERLAEDKRWIIDERDRTFAMMLSRAEEAEAEIERLLGDLAKAMQFTKRVIRHADFWGDDYLAEQARTALAELTGAKT